jgi:hypothetical protein
VLALYYYLAYDPHGGEFRDLSCRPDPDFSTLSLGICRTPLRKRFARLAAHGPIELIFYTVRQPEQTLLLTARLTVDTIFQSHDTAAVVLQVKSRWNLLVPGNPCTKRTVFRKGMRTTMPANPECDCLHYIGRSASPYLTFDGETAALRVSDPVELPFAHLKQLCPDFFRANPVRRQWYRFQSSTSNDCHFVSDIGEQNALRALLPHSGGPTSQGVLVS